MDELDFTIEFYSDAVSKDVEDALFVEAEERLQALASGHNDVVGAAINIRQPAHGETAYLYEATVVVYSRPEHVAATGKEDNPTSALKGALSAVERQIRQRRTKLRKRWQQPGNDPDTTEWMETAAAQDLDLLDDEAFTRQEERADDDDNR